MPRSRSIPLPAVSLAGLVTLTLLLCGCQKAEQIERYKVASHASLQTSSFADQQDPRKRMIGAIIPKEPETWFFKMEGSDKAVMARIEDVRGFLKTLRFATADKPLPNGKEIDWDLPAGWKVRPASEFRYATIVLDGEPPLEMSVTKLPFQPGMELAQQVLLNVNRWRNQFSLAPITEEELPTKVEKMDFSDYMVFWVNIFGRPQAKPSGMMQPPRQ